MYEENNIYKKILDERLKEIEFWKRKFIENCQKFESKNNFNLTKKILDFFTKNFKISFDFNNRGNFIEEYDIFQKLLEKDFKKEIFKEYFEKINYNYNSIIEENTLNENLYQIKNKFDIFKLELLKNIEKENKKEKGEDRNFNLLKNNYFNSLETFNKDLKEIINKNKKLEESENIVNLCKFHLTQINNFNKLLLEENSFFQKKVNDMKKIHLSHIKMILNNFIMKIEYLFNGKNCKKILNEIKNLEKNNIVC